MSGLGTLGDLLKQAGLQVNEVNPEERQERRKKAKEEHQKDKRVKYAVDKRRFDGDEAEFYQTFKDE